MKVDDDHQVHESESENYGSVSFSVADVPRLTKEEKKPIIRNNFYCHRNSSLVHEPDKCVLFSLF